MSARRTWATAARVLRQIRHDHRTVAMLVVVPVLIMTIMHWILPAHDFATFGPPLLGIFPLLIMFLITSVTTLRERSGGTLERLLSMPVAKADIVGGYALAFGVLGALLRSHGYVPLNPAFPTDRTRAMLQRSGCRSLIVDHHGARQLEEVLDGVEGSLVLLLPEHNPVIVAKQAASLEKLKATVGSLTTTLGGITDGATAEKAKGAASEHATPFSEITDDDIDALFG